MGDELGTEDDGTMMGGDGDGSEGDELGTEDDGTMMGGDGGDSLGTDDEAGAGMDGDESMEGDTDTVGGVTGLGATGTGGLADSRSSAALWGGIGSALALLALLGGGFAVRRRAQSRS